MNDMTPAPISVERLRELIAEYWDLAYAEGVESRSHDTPAGDAMRVSAEIDKCISALLHQLAELERDNATMRDADYHQVGVEQEQEIIDLEAKLAEREAGVERLLRGVREMSDRFNKTAADLRAAERAREEAFGVLRDIAEYKGDPTTPIHNSVKKSAIARAFLAYSGGGRED